MSTEPSLFDFSGGANDDSRAVELARLREIGAIYQEVFLDEEECRRLLGSIDQQPWLHDLKRRVQHYGWKYDYAARFITKDMRIGRLPGFILDVAAKLGDHGWFRRIPDQVIVNEYEPTKKQGIAPHVDRECFGPTVATLSLGDAWPMEFAAADRSRRRTERFELVLDIGSILVLRGESRSKWTHGIAPRQTDGHGRNRRRRRRRVSVTFRTVERVDSESVDGWRRRHPR